MAGWWDILGAVLAVGAVIAAGYGTRRLNWLTEEADVSLFNLTVRLLMPCFFVDRILGNALLRQADNVWLPPVVGFASVAAGLGLAALYLRLGRRWSGIPQGPPARTFVLTVGLYNYGYLAIPIADRLFGQETVGVVAVHNVGVELCLWTLGVLALTGGLTHGWWKRLLNPMSLTIVGALAVNALLPAGYPRQHLPGFLMVAVHMLGECAIPMGLLLAGATMADFMFKSGLRSGLRVVAGASLLRLAALPLLFLLLAWALPCSRDLKRVIVVQAAMASAVIPIVMAKRFGGDPPTALRVTLGTSLVSLVTTPLWLAAGIRWLGLD